MYTVQNAPQDMEMNEESAAPLQPRSHTVLEVLKQFNNSSYLALADYSADYEVPYCNWE